MAIVAFGAQGLDLFEHEDNEGDRFEPEHTGLVHLALAAESLEELQRWASWLDAHDVPHSEIRTFSISVRCSISSTQTAFNSISSWGVRADFAVANATIMRRPVGS